MLRLSDAADYRRDHPERALLQFSVQCLRVPLAGLSR